MDAYHIALFLHIVTLIVAVSATAVSKLAGGRRIRARTVSEALEWHNLLVSTSKLFPICLAAFLATGAYMVSVAGARVWAAGFVVAGLIGITLLFASGTYLGIKAKGLGQLLATAASKTPDAAPPKLVPPTLVAVLPVVNTGIALAVVFDMVTKPASVVVALTVIGVGIVVSAFVALRQGPAAARVRVNGVTNVPNEIGLSSQ
jgi:hypothetical protein